MPTRRVCLRNSSSTRPNGRPSPTGPTNRRHISTRQPVPSSVGASRDRYEILGIEGVGDCALARSDAANRNAGGVEASLAVSVTGRPWKTDETLLRGVDGRADIGEVDGAASLHRGGLLVKGLLDGVNSRHGGRSRRVQWHEISLGIVAPDKADLIAREIPRSHFDPHRNALQLPVGQPAPEAEIRTLIDAHSDAEVTELALKSRDRL